MGRAIQYIHPVVFESVSPPLNAIILIQLDESANTSTSKMCPQERGERGLSLFSFKAPLPLAHTDLVRLCTAPPQPDNCGSHASQPWPSPKPPCCRHPLTSRAGGQGPRHVARDRRVPSLTLNSGKLKFTFYDGPPSRRACHTMGIPAGMIKDTITRSTHDGAPRRAPVRLGLPRAAR